jgi:hypothetical protein
MLVVQIVVKIIIYINIYNIYKYIYVVSTVIV